MKLIVTASLFAIASSLFANNIDVRHSYPFICDKGTTIYLNGKDIVVDKKGYLPKFDELEGLQISKALFFTGDKKQHSVQFFKDGFAYQNKLYKFSKDFSDEFISMLKNDFSFGSVCAFETEDFEKASDKDLSLIWSHTELSDEVQKMMEKWVYHARLYATIDSYEFRMKTSSLVEHFPKDLFDPKSYLETIEKIKTDTNELLIEAKTKYLEDIKRVEIARQNNKYAVTYVRPEIIQEFQNLKRELGARYE